MTRFEKILLVLVVAWIVQAASGPWLQRLMVESLAARASDKQASLDASTLYYAFAATTRCVVNFVFGLWLFLASKHEKEKKWLWASVGFFGGIYGVLIFYPYLILKEIRARTEPNQALQRNAGSRPSSGDSPASETPSSLGPRG